MKRFDGFKAGLEISDEEYKWIDFSLDKTYKAMFEAGKQFKELFAAYLVIVIVSWILTYSKGAATEPGTSTVKVPLLDLLLDRRHAAIAAVVIATGILVALVCLVVYEEVLRWRAEGLVLIRYGAISQVGDVPSDNYWYLRFPSLLRMSLFLSGSQTIIENVFAYVFLLILVTGLFFPGMFAWSLGKQLSWHCPARLGLTVGISILPFLATLLLITVFRRAQAAANVFPALEKYFRTKPQ